MKAEQYVVNVVRKKKFLYATIRLRRVIHFVAACNTNTYAATASRTVESPSDRPQGAVRRTVAEVPAALLPR